MKRKYSVLFKVFLCLFFAFIFVSSIFGSVQNPKGNIFIFILDKKIPPNLSEQLITEYKISSSKNDYNAKIKTVFYNLSDDKIKKDDIIKDILNKDSDYTENIAGIFYINSSDKNEKVSENPFFVNIELHNYPFGSIAEEHIDSPEYTFKFSSDSALLGLLFYKNIRNSKISFEISDDNLGISFLKSSDIRLTDSLYKKYAKINLPDFKILPEDDIKILAEIFCKTAYSFISDNSFYMIGILPEKVLKKAELKI